MKELAIVKIIIALCGDHSGCIAATMLKDPKTPREAAQIAAKWHGCTGHGDGRYEACVANIRSKP